MGEVGGVVECIEMLLLEVRMRRSWRGPGDVTSHDHLIDLIGGDNSSAATPVTD